MHAVALGLICCYMPYLWTRFAVFYDCFAVLFGAGKLVCCLPSVVFGDCGLENCLIQHLTNAHRPIHNCNNTNVRNSYKVQTCVLWSWDSDLRSSITDLAVFWLCFTVFCGLGTVICGIPTLICGLTGVICGNFRSSRTDLRCLAVLCLCIAVFCGLGIVICGLPGLIYGDLWWFAVFRQTLAVWNTTIVRLVAKISAISR